MNGLLEESIAAHRAGNLVEAERLYRAVLAQDPNRADVLYNLGMIYGQWQRPADALRHFSQAVTIKPDFGEAWFMVCEFADQMDQQALNLKAGEEAVRLLPDMPRAWLRYGLALSRLERDGEAIAAYGRAIELDPHLIKAWVNLAFSSKASGKPDDAHAAIRRAIEIAGQGFATDKDAEPTYSFLHWHLALIELLLGHYREGFAHFRARFQGGTNWRREDYGRPLWQGENLSGKTILVTAEQGYGDVLMMARYLPLLKERGAYIISQVHPALERYFTGWTGADAVVAIGAKATTMFDYHTAIFDLPYWFGTTLDTIPAQTPYLPVPSAMEESRLPDDVGLKIGVMWAGQPDNIRGKNRSVPLELFADLFDVPGCAFFSLTRDLRSGEADLMPRYPITDLAPRIHDFADTATFMSQFDLVITCDTATAHLAGGMGKKTWTLLPFVADWRWGRYEAESRWYPTMRLFRQMRKDDWTDVVAQVKTELRLIV